MNITIPSNATLQSIKNAFPAPRAATHFRFTEKGRKSVIDAIKNLDTLAGCSGKLEFGKPKFEGRGRYARIKGFISLGVASAPAPEPEQAAPETSPEPVTPESAPAEPATSKTGGRLSRIHGFSACAVAKALGRAGVKYAEADHIFRAHGIEMPKASLSVQLGFGRKATTWERHGKPAELSEAQIAELRAEVAQQI